MSKKPYVTNIGDPEQIADAKIRMKLDQEKSLSDLLYVLDDARGRRFLWALIESCGFFQTSMTGSSQTFFNEGQRNVALRLFAQVTEADPNAFTKMILEAKEGELKNV